MPTFHIQVAGQASGPDGRPIAVPPGTFLQRRGPVIQVSIGLEQGMAQTLTQQGKSVPQLRTGYALIDTGASVSCIDDQVAAEMKLPVIDIAQMTSATHDQHPCNIYPIQIIMPASGVVFGAPRALGAKLAPQDLIAIIGRDILSICTMFYNGSQGQVTLSL